MERKLCDDYATMFRNIVDFTCEYVANNKIETLVLGMSGGIDSTLCAALASEVCRQLDTGVTVEGRVLPIESNYIEMSRATMASRAFCDSFKTNQMTPIYTALSKELISDNYTHFGILIRLGNIKARLRMIKLYDVANRMKGMVLSTDNYTEYMLGFWTLHGDVGDYGMIQNLWKTEVYGLANYLLEEYKYDDELYKAASLQECIKAMPTDGLGIGNTDFDQIYSDFNKNATSVDIYGEIDAILLNHLNEPTAHSNSEVIDRHKATEFKRLNPFSIPRENLVG